MLFVLGELEICIKIKLSLFFRGLLYLKIFFIFESGVCCCMLVFVGVKIKKKIEKKERNF